MGDSYVTLPPMGGIDLLGPVGNHQDKPERRIGSTHYLSVILGSMKRPRTASRHPLCYIRAGSNPRSTTPGEGRRSHQPPGWSKLGAICEDGAGSEGICGGYGRGSA